MSKKPPAKASGGLLVLLGELLLLFIDLTYGLIVLFLLLGINILWWMMGWGDKK